MIFFLFNVLPGDPAQMMLGQNENSEQLNIVKKKYGFDKPLSTQYFYYLNDLSPISIHSLDKSDYSFFDRKNYSGIELFKLSEYSINIKYPYLRTSFVNHKFNNFLYDIFVCTFPSSMNSCYHFFIFIIN